MDGMERIAGVLEKIHSELRAIRRVMECDANGETSESCPNCDGTDFQDTTDFGQPKRVTCMTCGKSFQEAKSDA